MTLAGRLSRLVPRAGFGRSVVVLVGGSAASQLLGLVAAPFLTRLFSPDAFGVAAQFTSVASIAAVCACLRYELALPLPREEEDGVSLLTLSMLIAAAFSVVAGVLFYALRDQISGWLSTPALAGYLWLVGPAVFVMALQQTTSYWSMREGRFNRLARSRVAQGGGTAAVQLGAGFAGAGPGGLIVGQVLGQLAAAAVLLWSTLADWRRLRATITRRRLHDVIVRYRRFPIFSTWDGLVVLASLQLPVLLVAGFAGTLAAGFYALSFRILQLPVNLIGIAVAQVFYPDAARARQSGDLARTGSLVFVALWRLTLPLGIVLIVGAPDLFAFVFGERWTEAGVYTQWLTPLMVLTLLSAPLSTVVLVRERQAQNLAFQAVALVVRSVALVAGIEAGGATTGVAALGVVSAILWTGYLVWCLRLSEVPLRSLARPIRRGVALALAIALPAIVAKVLTLWIAGSAIEVAGVVVSLVLWAWACVAYLGSAEVQAGRSATV